MLPLLRDLIHALLFDQLAVRRWIRGGLLGAATMASQVLAAGPDVAATWTARQWAFRGAAALAAMAAGMISHGEMNPKP